MKETDAHDQDEFLEQAYENGTHYDQTYLRKHSVKNSKGQNPSRVIVLDLGIGDSVERLDSGKGQKIYGPNSVRTVFWPDGGIDQTVFDIGRAPEMPRNTYDGRYIKPGSQLGRKGGEGYDKTLYPLEPGSGEEKSLYDWAADERCHESVDTALIRSRVKTLHWSVQKAMTTPRRAR